MILFNVAQARSNTLAHNDELRKIIDIIIGTIIKSVEEGKFKTGNLRFSPAELKGSEPFIKGYFESLGYSCSVNESRGAIFIEVSWY